MPTSDTRWRCTRCGNLTRFDVQRLTRVSEYWHADLSGAPTVEETTVIADDIESVSCRWCGTSDSIELVLRVIDESEASSTGTLSTGGESQ